MSLSTFSSTHTPFPPEIVIQVLQHLPANDKSALARASLVCRWMQRELSPKLYHTVELSSPLKVEQMFSTRTHDQAGVSPFLSLSQIHSLTLKLPPTPSGEPLNLSLSRLGPTTSRPASFPHSLHLVLGPPDNMYPSLLSLLTPSHLTISREPHPSFSGPTLYFPMFRQLDRTGTTDAALASWTMLRSIHLIDTYLLSSGSFYLGRFAFEPVLFDEPVEITFDFSKAGRETGLENVQLELLFVNFATKGVVGVSEIGKLEVRVGSVEQRDSVEAGRRSVRGFPMLDRAEVVLVKKENVL